MDICESISNLAYLSGIELQATIEEKVGLLKAMDILDQNFDYPTQNAEKQAENLRLVEKIIDEKRNANFINIVHHIPILRQNKVPSMEISLPDGVKKLKWNFYEDEDPKKYYKGEIVIDDSEKFYSGEVAIDDLERVESNGDEVERTIDGVTYRKYRFKFPFDVRLGYHNVSFSYVNDKGEEVSQIVLLLICPVSTYRGEFCHGKN